MTAEYVAFHAAARPNAVAFIINGREISYGKFARDIQKVTWALREFELPRGAKVAIGLGDKIYFRWLLRLAFERLCVVTFDRLENLTSPGFVGDFDLVLTQQKIDAEIVKRQFQITPEWLNALLAGPDRNEQPLPIQGPDDPVRVLFTSGTTGTPKKLLYSRRVHEGSVRAMMWFGNFTRESRHMDMSGVVAPPTACIRAGGTLVFDNQMMVPEVIASRFITHISLSPIKLRQLLDILPNVFAKPAAMKILSSGAALSRGLRRQADVRLATEVRDTYGSNEAGYVSSISDDTEWGAVWPGVQIEIVDERHKPIPFGEVGQIRVKTDRMVQGYLDDPEATGRIFKDGWFYARDLGILQSSHRLQVIGRSDDVLNISGHKISPHEVEDWLIKFLDVGDAGVCSIHNADGIEEIVIVVSGARAGEQELLERIEPALNGLPVGKINILKVDRIPRNANGKIQRNLLKDAAAANSVRRHLFQRTLA